MRYCSLRWTALVLVALMGGTSLLTMSADAASAATTTKRKTLAASTSVKRAAKKRRARRAPPGGVYARHAIVLDPATGEVLFSKNSASTVPIASITKLMTAMVFIEQQPDLLSAVEVTSEEIRGGGHTQLRHKEKVLLGDLLHMSLMCSDNVATRVLVRESGLALPDFLARMNRKSAELGLANTRFVEVTGLDEKNVSSAADVARLLHAAADQEMIQAISTTQAYEFRAEYRDRPRVHRIPNTNRLLYNHSMQVLGGKTGFISEAGYCLCTWIRVGGRDMIAVVLGAPTNATRFADVVRMVQKTMREGLEPSRS